MLKNHSTLNADAYVALCPADFEIVKSSFSESFLLYNALRPYPRKQLDKVRYSTTPMLNCYVVVNPSIPTASPAYLKHSVTYIKHMNAITESSKTETTPEMNYILDTPSACIVYIDLETFIGDYAIWILTCLDMYDDDAKVKVNTTFGPLIIEATASPSPDLQPSLTIADIDVSTATLDISDICIESESTSDINHFLRTAQTTIQLAVKLSQDTYLRESARTHFFSALETGLHSLTLDQSASFVDAIMNNPRHLSSLVDHLLNPLVKMDYESIVSSITPERHVAFVHDSPSSYELEQRANYGLKLLALPTDPEFVPDHTGVRRELYKLFWDMGQ